MGTKFYLSKNQNTVVLIKILNVNNIIFIFSYCFCLMLLLHVYNYFPKFVQPHYSMTCSIHLQSCLMSSVYFNLVYLASRFPRREIHRSPISLLTTKREGFSFYSSAPFLLECIM